MEVLLREIYNKPITLKPYHTLDDAKNKMIKHNISRIVVEVDDKPVGIITEKDI
ncbi:MAG: CBS domain-containing protein, partial [Candidatus Nitrosothermus koennekii]